MELVAKLDLGVFSPVVSTESILRRNILANAVLFISYSD